MTQLPLIYPRASRRSDPSSSAAAEQDLTTSGARDHQCRAVLDAVRDHPGSTSRELTRWLDLDRYQIARRLPDLEHAGKVRQGAQRRCAVGGRLSVTWWVV